MMLLRPQPSQPSPSLHRKRKADAQPDSNERLSKRLSLLNLEQNGAKLYVPVENAQRADASSSTYSSSPQSQLQPQPQPQQPSSAPAQPSPIPSEDEPMQVDDSKHKVYIYNIEDELSSSSESEPEEGKEAVVFLPNIEKHLRANRIPPHVLLSGRDLEPDLAAKQLVLYRVPTSLTVPEERDGVRRAVIEARQRARERQLGVSTDVPMEAGDDPDAMELD